MTINLHHGSVRAVLYITALLLGTSPALAADSEDLTNIKLPHGQLTIPEADAAPANQGYVVRFSDEKLFRIGGGEGPEALDTPQQVFERMKREKKGDLVYTKADMGSLFVLSGKVMDLGPQQLQFYTKYELPPPRATNGTISRIQEGSVYLLQATDGNFVLIRVLHRTDAALVLQYIYQSDGGRDFSMVHAIPAKAPVPAVQDTPTLVVAPQPPAGGAISEPQSPSLDPLAQHLLPSAPNNPLANPPTAVLIPYLDTYLRQRDAMIARRIETIRAPANSGVEIQTKTLAMDDLRQLRAWEAIPVLIDEISFLNPHARPIGNQLSMETFHPALAALKSLGKPASVAALKAIGDLSLEGDPTPPNGDATKAPIYKLHLLVLVVSGVEGPDVAAFLLQRQARTDPAHQANYLAALKDIGQ